MKEFNEFNIARQELSNVGYCIIQKPFLIIKILFYFFLSLAPFKLIYDCNGYADFSHGIEECRKRLRIWNRHRNQHNRATHDNDLNKARQEENHA